MTRDELDAYRARNELGKAEIEWCGYGHDVSERAARTDIDALIAEVARLMLQVEGFQALADIRAHVAEMEEDAGLVWQVQLRDRDGTPVWFEQGSGGTCASWVPAVDRAREAARQPELSAVGASLFVTIDPAEFVMVDREASR